jgi:sterol desaturase/sphingolipid hydroxylase (fatty acid hydroxylase superfamily)
MALPPIAHAVMFPGALAGAVAAMLLAAHSGISLPLMQMAVFASVLVLIAVTERFMPATAAWNKSRRGDVRVDLTSFAVVMAAVDPMLKAVTPTILASLLTLLGAPASLQLFPSDWPFLVQLALAALIAEFGQYWMHRLAHELPVLWRFHALHHSAERLYWLNGFRVHPLNMIWHYFAGGFVLLVIGVGQEVVLTYFTLAGVVNAFQHANLALRLGPLNYVFSTNELHRWHHSDKPHEANRNYGGVLIVWDLVFGTYHHRPGAQPGRVGLYADSRYPLDSYPKQLVAPFLWSRMTAANSNDAGPARVQAHGREAS